jgi:hypothetical protein
MNGTPMDLTFTEVTRNEQVSACGSRNVCDDNKCTRQKCNQVSCTENVCNTQNCDFKGCYKPNQCDMQSCTTKARTAPGQMPGMPVEEGVEAYLEEQIHLLKALEQEPPEVQG